MADCFYLFLSIEVWRNVIFVRFSSDIVFSFLFMKFKFVSGLLNVASLFVQFILPWHFFKKYHFLCVITCARNNNKRFDTKYKKQSLHLSIYSFLLFLFRHWFVKILWTRRIEELCFSPAGTNRKLVTKWRTLTRGLIRKIHPSSYENIFCKKMSNN